MQSWNREKETQMQSWDREKETREIWINHGVYLIVMYQGEFLSCNKSTAVM